MNRILLSLRLLAVAASFALALHGCGGGTDVAGVGSGGSGLAGGTVSGFGSVFVDGVEIDDSQAGSVTDTADAGTASAAAKLGQRVSLRLGADGKATRIAIEPTVVGVVAALSAADGTLRVAGQLVRINTDATAAPLTVFGGTATAFTQLAVGDPVEVHGSRDGAGTIVATRVEKLAVVPVSVRVHGPVGTVDADAARFTIGSLLVRVDGALDASLSSGAVVTVWGKLSGTANAPVLQASRVASPAGVVQGASAQYGGIVASLDTVAGTFRLHGIPVRYAGAQVLPSAAALVVGRSVRVSGTLGSDGSITATGVQVRQAPAGDRAARVRLIGAISSLSDARSFVVRDVAVDASGVASICGGATLAVGAAVDVDALQQPGTDVVKAVTVSCPGAASLPAHLVREVRGTASAVDVFAGTFTLRDGSGVAIGVRWTARTVFTGTTPSGLQGAAVVVSGSTGTDGVLTAREVRAPGTREADRFDPSNGPGAWTQYDMQFRPSPNGPPASP